MSYKAPGIREVGLQAYLDRTAGAHDNKVYADFVYYHAHAHLSAAAIGRIFRVERRTVSNWIVIYKEEQNVKA